MAYQMAATAVTLNDLGGHSPVAGLLKYNPDSWTFVQHFTRFQLRMWSHGFSALAELLVFFSAFYFSAEKDLCTFGIILFFGQKLLFSAVNGTENDESK